MVDIIAVTEAPPKTEEDNFAAAFAQITEADNAPPATEKQATSATDVVEAKPGTTTEEAPVTQTPEEEAAAAAAAAAAAEAAKKPTPATTTQTVSDDDLVRRLGNLLKTAETPAVETPQEEQTQQFSQDEMTFLDTYVKEFPDIAKAEALIRKAEYRAVVGYVFSSMQRELAPMIETLRTLSERTHLGDVQAAVPDYAATREAVVEWVAKQPAYLKVAYEHVIKQGTVDEVADLIGRYKAANPAPAVAATGTTVAEAAAGTTTGTTTASKGVTTAQAAVPAAKPAVGELSPAAKRAAAALAPVGSKRSGTSVSATDPNDFDAAFASFAKDL